MTILVSLLLGLVVPVALVVWLVHAVRNAGGDGGHPGLSLRRFLQFGFLLAAVCTAAVGVSGLGELTLPTERVSGRASSDLALGLSLSIVAVPVAFGLWRLVRRRIVTDPDEQASTAWSLYLAVISTVSVTVALVGLVQLGAWAVGAEPFPPGGTARAVVWGAVWVAHLRLAGDTRYRPTGRIADLAVLAGSAVGLITLVLGTGHLVFVGLEHLYLSVTGTFFVGVPLGGGTVRVSAVVAVLGAGLWWWTWLRQARSLPRSTLWYGYVLCVPILGGLLAVVGSAATVLHAVLQWSVGVRDSMASGHFAVVPGALATGVVGAWAFAYHRAVLDEVDGRARTEPERAYEYIGAAVGLLAASAGVAVTLVALVEALGPSPLAGPDPTGRGVVVTALTLLAVGGPLWWVFWRRLADPTGGERERGSPSRRAYLFLLFGAAGLTAGVSLMVVLFVALRDLFDGSLDGQSLLDLRVALALALTAGALSGYHWTVYREDRSLQPDESPARDRSVLIVAVDPGPLAQAVRAATGASVRVLRRLDTTPPAADPAAEAPAEAPGEATGEEERTAVADGAAARGPDASSVVRAIEACPHPRVLVLVDGDEVTVVPYQSG